MSSKLTFLALLTFFAVTFLFPTKVLAFPFGLRIIYYDSNGNDTGRDYYCFGQWFSYGTPSASSVEDVDPRYCQGGEFINAQLLYE